MWYILAGILGGIIGGMGMGGGTLLVPILSLMLGVEQKSSQLINMISFLPMAIFTVIINAKAKLIKWKYLVYVGVSGTISAILSSMLVGVIDASVLRIIFGVFLIVLSAILSIVTIVKMYKKKKSSTLTSINVTKIDDEY